MPPSRNALRLTRCLMLVVLGSVLVLTHGEPVPRSQAQAPAPRRPVVERWDTYPAGSVERQRVVGRLILTLRPGMTRQQVENIVGPADDPRETEYFIGENDHRGLCKYYHCQLPHFPTARHGIFDIVVVAYDLIGPLPILFGVGHCTHTEIKRLVGPEELFR